MLSATCVDLTGAAALAGWPSFKIEGRIDHRQVGKRLREVPQELTSVRIELLSEESQVVRGFGHPAEQSFRVLQPPHLSEHIDQPKGADDKDTLRLMKFGCFRPVAVQKPIVAELLL